MKTLVLVNPASAGGRTGQRWQAERSLFAEILGEHEAHLTDGPRQAAAVVRSALRAGVERVVAVGGDGTNHEVVNGFFDPDSHEPIAPAAIFGFVPSGTGGDFGKTFGVSKRTGEHLCRIRDSAAQGIDVVSLSFAEAGGQAREIALNIVSVGQGGDVCTRVDRGSKLIGGALPFVLAGLGSLLATRPWQAHLCLDEGEPQPVAVRNLVVANGRFHGGGMQPAPAADPSDGWLEVVLLGGLGRLAALRAGLASYKGRMQEHAGVLGWRARTVRLEPLPDQPPMLMEMDGEARGQAPLVMRVLPGALRLAV